jgi:hypothetical protein
MANRHFGKLSEVWKDGALSEILAEDLPACYADTRAGSADYALTHSPDRDYGVFRFLSRCGASVCQPRLHLVLDAREFARLTTVIRPTLRGADDPALRRS